MAGTQAGLEFARSCLADVVERLEDAVSRLETLARSGGSEPTTEREPAAYSKVVEDFDETVMPSVQKFNKTCSSIGDVVGQLGSLVLLTFQQQRDFICRAAASTKPDQQAMQKLLEPTSSSIEAISVFIFSCFPRFGLPSAFGVFFLEALKEANRSSLFFNHLSAISESISAVGWVTVAPAPVPFIAEMMDSAQFFLNRILKDFKDKDPLHKDFVHQWLDVLGQLKSYVKVHHTVGFSWNALPASGTFKISSLSQTGFKWTTPSNGVVSQGGEILKGPVNKGPSSVGAPPPPPPPPPPDFMASDLTPKSHTNLRDARQALFAEINKGLDICKGLKKVTPEMQTHKNPALRTAERTPATGKPKVASKPAHLTSKRASPKPDLKPATLELQGGKKWMVEYQVDTTPTIEIQDMKQVVYMYKCVNCTLQIKGKLNSITMDACKRSRIVFDDLVSTVDVINCEKVEVQTLGTLPTITIQKTDGCLLYLSRSALDCEVVSSRSSEMNVLIPKEDGEYVRMFEFEKIYIKRTRAAASWHFANRNRSQPIDKRDGHIRDAVLQEYSIPEQFKTFWNGKQLESKPTDSA
ncbi:adenylyl cyclase associated protein 1 [Trichuris trichiura]|uniref:Adenylyl cyclase-associated protein n=1 Tax=Trichuris trichiura TaxID=36087 RepID=A0A077Z7C2_TRITR|nr:adenylyl cyclase associated protein 1 [Trichuris trichiura]